MRLRAPCGNCVINQHKTILFSTRAQPTTTTTRDAHESGEPESRLMTQSPTWPRKQLDTRSCLARVHIVDDLIFISESSTTDGLLQHEISFLSTKNGKGDLNIETEFFRSFAAPLRFSFKWDSGSFYPLTSPICLFSCRLACNRARSDLHEQFIWCSAQVKCDRGD